MCVCSELFQSNQPPSDNRQHHTKTLRQAEILDLRTWPVLKYPLDSCTPKCAHLLISRLPVEQERALGLSSLLADSSDDSEESSGISDSDSWWLLPEEVRNSMQPVKGKKTRPQPKRPPAPPCPTRTAGAKAGDGGSVASDASKSTRGQKGQPQSQQQQQQAPPSARRRRGKGGAGSSVQKSEDGGASTAGDLCMESTVNSSTRELPRPHPLLFLRERSLSLSSIADG